MRSNCKGWVGRVGTVSGEEVCRQSSSPTVQLDSFAGASANLDGLISDMTATESTGKAAMQSGFGCDGDAEWGHRRSRLCPNVSPQAKGYEKRQFPI